MGKAARTKQIRRNGRTWSARNPWTGEREQFRVFISDQGLAEWERDRVRLAKNGYPDYPPAVDSAKSRAWAMEPNTPIRSADLAQADPADPREGLWVSDDAHLIVKGIVHSRTDGRFDVTISVADKDGLGFYTAAERPLPITEKELPGVHEAVARVARLLALPSPKWVSASDLDLSVALAAA